MSEAAQTPVEVMTRAVADLWSQVIESGDDFVIFHDHYGNPARVRIESGEYRIAWVVEEGDHTRWDESAQRFDNPREAALHAFQGPTLGRSA